MEGELAASGISLGWFFSECLLSVFLPKPKRPRFFVFSLDFVLEDSWEIVASVVVKVVLLLLLNATVGAVWDVAEGAACRCWTDGQDSCFCAVEGIEPVMILIWLLVKIKFYSLNLSLRSLFPPFFSLWTSVLVMYQGRI